MGTFPGEMEVELAKIIFLLYWFKYIFTIIVFFTLTPVI
jgi:hypothetical protein